MEFSADTKSLGDALEQIHGVVDKKNRSRFSLTR
jgi:hypothetical protein